MSVILSAAKDLSHIFFSTLSLNDYGPACVRYWLHRRTTSLFSWSDGRPCWYSNSKRQITRSKYGWRDWTISARALWSKHSGS